MPPDVRAVVERPAEVTDPTVLSPPEVRAPAMRMVADVISEAVSPPLRVKEAADNAEAERPVVDNNTAVILPPVETPAARTRPEIEAVFATKLPEIVAVFVASAPMMTADADGPRRTTPLTRPVPASKVRSPPFDDASPAA
jgi:hypothetical protein